MILPHLWGFWFWPRYLIAGSGAFLVAEIYALITDPASSLSNYSWTELGIGNALKLPQIHSVAWYISLIAWILFVIVITAHIWWRQRIG